MSNLLEAQNSGMGRNLMFVALVVFILSDFWIAFLAYVIMAMAHEGGPPERRPLYWGIVAAFALAVSAPFFAAFIPVKLKWRLAIAALPVALILLPMWLSNRF